MIPVMCPGCGLTLPAVEEAYDNSFNSSSVCRQKYYELSYFTLALGDDYFVHQLLVDAYAAQHYGLMMKPITITFALIGLFMVNEHRYSGKQVQELHGELAKYSKEWPIFAIPKTKTKMTIEDVLSVSDDQKITQIKRWNTDVWNIWKSEQRKIEETIRNYTHI